MVMIDPLLKIAAQKIFVSVEIKRGQEIEHTLVIHNQSEFTVQLIEIETAPRIPLGFGNNLPIDDSKIFKNQTLIPGQRIENLLDKESIKEKRTDHKITVKYKTFFAEKIPPQPVQKSNTCIYKPLGHTVPVMAAMTQRYN